MNDKDLIKLALKTAQNAYAPYSKFYVGAVAEFKNGEFFTGCNVENASYGLALCAERNAISTGIANGNHSKLKKVVIASPNTKKCLPCGACRQWIWEFGEDVSIIVEGEEKILTYNIKQLLPEGFDKSLLF